MSRILLVDDDNDFRETFREVLVKNNYDVVTACNGNEALSSYRNQAADLVIMDIIMPDKDGLETIFQFNKELPATKIIAISGGGAVRGIDYLNTANSIQNVKAIFQKPFSMEKILLAIKEIIE